MSSCRKVFLVYPTVDSAAHSVNDDDGITGATKVMKLIYYASLYGGKRDSGKVSKEILLLPLPPFSPLDC